MSSGVAASDRGFCNRDVGGGNAPSLMLNALSGLGGDRRKQIRFDDCDSDAGCGTRPALPRIGVKNMDKKDVYKIQEIAEKGGAEMYDLGYQHGQNKVLADLEFKRALKALRENMGIMEEVT